MQTNFIQHQTYRKGAIIHEKVDAALRYAVDLRMATRGYESLRLNQGTIVPSVQLDNLDTVEDLVHDLNTGVFLFHLLDLREREGGGGEEWRERESERVRERVSD